MTFAKESPAGWDLLCQGVFGRTVKQCAVDPFNGQNIYDDQTAMLTAVVALVGLGGIAAACAVTDGFGCLVAGAGGIGEFAATGGVAGLSIGTMTGYTGLTAVDAAILTDSVENMGGDTATSLGFGDIAGAICKPRATVSSPTPSSSSETVPPKR